MYSYAYIDEVIEGLEQQIKTQERIVLPFGLGLEVVNMLKQLSDRSKDADYWESEIADLAI